MLISYGDVFFPIIREIWDCIKWGDDLPLRIHFEVRFKFYERVESFYVPLIGRLTLRVQEDTKIEDTDHKIFERIFERFIDYVTISFSDLIQKGHLIHLFEISPVVKIINEFNPSKVLFEGSKGLLKYMVREEELSSFDKEGCKEHLVSEISSLRDDFDAIIIRFYTNTRGRWLKLFSEKLIADPFGKIKIKDVHKIVDDVFDPESRICFFEFVPLYAKLPVDLS